MMPNEPLSGHRSQIFKPTIRLTHDLAAAAPATEAALINSNLPVFQYQQIVVRRVILRYFAPDGKSVKTFGYKKLSPAKLCKVLGECAAFELVGSKMGSQPPPRALAELLCARAAQGRSTLPKLPVEIADQFRRPNWEALEEQWYGQDVGWP
jgi:hypothetical protein